MATEFFKNFPKVQYKLNDGRIIYIKDFFRKSKIEQEAVQSIVDYSKYEIQEGERPDIVATKLYGNPDLHWIFFVVNEFENYYDWHKDSETFERYMTAKYPGQYAVASTQAEIVSAKTAVADVSNKYLLGEKVTSVSSEGRITRVEPEHHRIAIEGGDFKSNELITGAVSTRTFTPTSVVEERDGVAYYINAEGLKRNCPATGYTAVSHDINEQNINEEKRKIKVIRPSLIDTIVRRFEKVMRA